MATKANKTITPELCAEGMAVCEQVARKYGKLYEDVLGAAYEAMLLSYQSFDPSRGVPFGAYARLYVREYCRREATRLQSVVVTNAARVRKLDCDDSLNNLNADGEEVATTFADYRTLADERCEAQESLRETYLGLMEAVEALPQSQRDLAIDLVKSRLVVNVDDVSLATVAERHGVTRQYAHKIEKALIDAAA